MASGPGASESGASESGASESGAAEPGASGEWAVHTVDGADVRLRSGRVGLMSLDVTAPVSGGELAVTADGVDLTLRLALNELRTRNFLMQAAARSLVSRYDAHVLTYHGLGRDPDGPWHVTGHAVAGTVDVLLELAVTPCGPSGDPMSEIDLVGSAQLGTVNLPLPGLGTIDDFAFDVDARLALRRRR